MNKNFKVINIWMILKANLIKLKVNQVLNTFKKH